MLRSDIMLKRSLFLIGMFILEMELPQFSLRTRAYYSYQYIDMMGGNFIQEVSLDQLKILVRGLVKDLTSMFLLMFKEWVMMNMHMYVKSFYFQSLKNSSLI